MRRETNRFQRTLYAMALAMCAVVFANCLALVFDWVDTALPAQVALITTGIASLIVTLFAQWRLHQGPSMKEILAGAEAEAERQRKGAVDGNEVC